MFNIAYFLSNYKLLYFASYYTFWESNSQIVYISVSRSLQLRSVVYTRMFIKSATFEFSAQKIFLSGKYQKNTLCKILADLKKLSWRRISIFWKHYIQGVFGIFLTCNDFLSWKLEGRTFYKHPNVLIVCFDNKCLLNQKRSLQK